MVVFPKDSLYFSQESWRNRDAAGSRELQRGTERLYAIWCVGRRAAPSHPKLPVGLGVGGEPMKVMAAYFLCPPFSRSP